MADNLSFEDMKAEFLSMDQEIKDKALEIETLRKKLKEREEAANKMVDQMEELHENLAELDARFERSEEMNHKLRSDKEDLQRDCEQEVKDVKDSVGSVERRFQSKLDEMTIEHTMLLKQKDFIIKAQLNEIEKLQDVKMNIEKELNEAKTELTNVRSEYQEYRNETDNKLENLRDSFKTSIEAAKFPINQYLEKNRGSKTPMKKTKGYRLLKNVDQDLKNILSTTTNNNIS